VRHAGSRFADSTQRAGVRRSGVGGRRAGLDFPVDAPKSGAPGFRRFIAPLTVLVLVAAAGLAATSAVAAEHLIISGEYGKEGPKATGLGNGCRLAYQSAENRLYLFSDGKIYGLNRTAPGSVSALGSPFPITAVNSGCGDPDMEVDNSSGSSKGNLFAIPSNPATISAWNSAGSALGSPWPLNLGTGEACGLDVDNAGNIYAGYYSAQSVTKISPAGSVVATIPVGFQDCKIAVDRTSGDIYVQPYAGSQALKKFTAASGYSTSMDFPASGTNNPGLAVNGSQHRLYVGTNGTTVKVYDTETAALVETINLGTSGGSGIAVDEPTDTLWVNIGSGASGYIREYLGVKLPKVTTGEPTANKEVSGTADPDGAGDITECYFEFGTTTSYGSTANCAESLPITSPQTVHAVLPGVVNETTYHYRLVLARPDPGAVARGVDKVITPHHVDFLHTGGVTNITRSSATLNASFNGTGLDTHYYFEYGLAAGSYTNKEPISAPPGSDAGVTSGNTPLSVNISGLVAVTIYHYRVVASNVNGISLGEDHEFETTKAIKELHTTPGTNITPTTATLNGEIDPDNLATSFYFEYGKTTAYGKTVPAPPGDSVGTTAPGLTPVSKDVTGLRPNTTYHFRLVGANSVGTTIATEDQSFKTPQPPSVQGVISKELTAQTAELEGRVNPNSEETTYYFEYGTTTDYGLTAPIPVGTLPAGNTPQTVTAHVDGLQRVPYHFRLVAESKWGKSVSLDQTFNFYPEPCPNSVAREQTASGHLPDCRAYELVTPSEAGTVNLFAAGTPTPRASSPPRLMYAGMFGTLPGVNAPNYIFDPYVATRTNAGWESHYAGIDASITGGPSGQPGLHGESGLNAAPVSDESLSQILQWRFSGPSLFARDFFYEGTRHYAPYVHGPEGQDLGRYPTNLADVPDADNPIYLAFDFSIIDAPDNGWTGDQELSDDGAHYFFSTNRYQFAPGGKVERDAGPGSVYDNDLETGEITIASKLPGTLGGGDIPAESTVPNHFIEVFGSSTDGSHLLIGAPSTCSTGGEGFAYFLCGEVFRYATAHLYMRVDGLLTYDVSQGKRVNFKGMTADASTVYFTSAEQLTSDDHDASIDLFMWSEATDEISRVSTSPEGNEIGDTDACSASWITKCGVEVVPAVGGGTNNEGENFLSKSSDNSVARESGDIYFYSPEQLIDSNAVPGGKNLYVRRGDGPIEYVATLESAAQRAITRIQVTPSGSHAAFLTSSPLTNYNNAGQAMVYLFDAQREEIICGSCLPNGDPPPVREFPGFEQIRVSVDGSFLSDDGRMFWSSPDALVPRDTNGEEDVYSYSGGRAQLITTGIGEKVARQPPCSLCNFFGKTGTLGVRLVGVSADGADVFFTTNETLVAQDHNGAFQKIYDARTNGGFPLLAEVAPCKAADECHAPTAPPPTAPNVTSTANLGAGGNVTPSSKSKKRKRAKKRAHRKRAAKHRRAHNHRRAGK
jgi:hypothetical protein